MNSSHNTFSLVRVGQLLRHYLVIERSSYIIYTLISIIVLQIPYLLAAYDYYASINKHYNEGETAIGLGGTFITLMLLFAAASMLMGSTESKQCRANHIMLPARTSEKFVAQLLICTVGASIVILASHLLGILSYCTLLTTMDAPSECYALATTFFEHCTTIIVYRQAPEHIMLKGILLMLYTICLLGATHWRKQKFMRNISIMFLTAPLPFILLDNLHDYVNDNKDYIITAIIVYTLSALFIWLAWRKYRRIQIIECPAKLWKPIASLLAIYIVLFSISAEERGTIIIDEPRVERITGTDFPHYTHVRETNNYDGGLLGDFSTTSVYRFDEQPTEEFYQRLDSLAQIKGPTGWIKISSPINPVEPQSDKITEYYFHSYWGNGSPAPEGENPDTDRHIHITITKGVNEFKITYGAH